MEKHVLTSEEFLNESMKQKVIDLYAKFYPKMKDDIDKWVKSKPSSMFTDKNEKFGLKIGDTITFKGGYNNDILFSSKIWAFDAKDGEAYVYWDSYWYTVDLEKNLVQK